MARRVGMSQTAVARIRRASGAPTAAPLGDLQACVRPGLREASAGPGRQPLQGRIERAAHDVVGFYLNPPDRALVLGVDETWHPRSVRGARR
jgi:hypothetical protein